jgi:hypothetical protein
MRHRGAVVLLLAWALIYSRDGEDGSVLDEFGSESDCMRVRAASIDGEIQDEIGGALASQTADNPMRQQAYDRASRKVASRYRCGLSSDDSD